MQSHSSVVCYKEKTNLFVQHIVVLLSARALCVPCEYFRCTLWKGQWWFSFLEQTLCASRALQFAQAFLFFLRKKLLALIVNVVATIYSVKRLVEWKTLFFFCLRRKHYRKRIVTIRPKDEDASSFGVSEIAGEIGFVNITAECIL